MSGVLVLGDLTAIPLAESVRRPGVGGNTEREIGPEGTAAGAWRLHADAGGAYWTACVTPGDLGVLRCDAGVTSVRGDGAALEIPAGSWVLRGDGKAAPPDGRLRPGSRRAAEARELAALIGEAGE